MRFKLFPLVLCFISNFAISDIYVAGIETSIVRVESYTAGSVAGHIRILTSTPVSGCEAGYFLEYASEGLDRTFSLALSAFHSGRKVVIHGRSGVSWSGSGNSSYCRIHSLSIV